jgi:hypothetical protein
VSPNRKNPASRSNAERAQNMPLPIDWDADAAAGWLARRFSMPKALARVLAALASLGRAFQ